MSVDTVESVTNRRGFFRRLQPGNKPAEIRPPWARPEAEFLERCSGCGECETACPEGIIIRGGGGYPVLDFGRGKCTFCTRCVDACTDDAFNRVDGMPAWLLKASVSEGCLAAAGVVCRVCGESCEEQAISFELLRGGCSAVHIAETACSGCGACISSCPVGAIQIGAYKSQAYNSEGES